MRVFSEECPYRRGQYNLMYCTCGSLNHGLHYKMCDAYAIRDLILWPYRHLLWKLGW